MKYGIAVEQTQVASLIAAAKDKALAKFGYPATINPEVLAEIDATTLGILAKVGMTAKQAIWQYAFRVYESKSWMHSKAHGDSWRGWVRYAMGKALNSKDLSLVRNGVPLLAQLKEHPVMDGDATINHVLFLNGKATLWQAALPVLARLEPGSREFGNVVTLAATQTREELRETLKKSYAVKPRRDKAAGFMHYAKQFTNPATGDVMRGDLVKITIIVPVNQARHVTGRLYPVATLTPA